MVLQGPTGLLFQWAPQSLRGWCNVPVAVMAQNLTTVNGKPVGALADAEASKGNKPATVVNFPKGE